MDISVAQVRLVFNVDSISAVAVCSNWLYLTGGLSSVVRINLDSPSQVQDIHIPRKHAQTAGPIKLLVASPTGKHLLAVTTRHEHFYYAESNQSGEFKHFAKLKGVQTQCAAFHPKRQGILLLGTKSGSVVEIGVDSCANEPYFKRDLKVVQTVYESTKPVNSILVRSGQGSGTEVVGACGSQVLQWTGSTTSSDESVFRSLLNKSPEVLINSNEEIKQVVTSPDQKSLAALLGPHKVSFVRERPNEKLEWVEVQVKSQINYLMLSNYHIMAAVSDGKTSGSVMAINVFSPNQIVYESIVGLQQQIRGGTVDLQTNTYWLFSVGSLLEVKLDNELHGLWKVLSDQLRFEEALDISSNKHSRAYILEHYGRHELRTGDSSKGAKMLGLSSAPLETAALEVMQNDKIAEKDKVLAELLHARLSITKSRAQQIMLTSWLAELGDYSFIQGDKFDAMTVCEVMKEQGQFDKYLELSTKSGVVHASIAYHIANEQWTEALELLRQYEQSDCVYRYAVVLMTKCPKQTVELWMRMSNLDIDKLLPSLMSYSNEYRGPLADNQALRFLKTIKLKNASVFNAIVTMYCQSQNAETELLTFLQDHAADYSNDQDFALRMCLAYKQHKSTVFLYTQMGLFEDAVELCLAIGTPEMCDFAVEIADKQVMSNEELRKYLLRMIVQQVIQKQGPQAASKFVRLLRVDDLLSYFPDFETLNELAPEIIKSLELTKTKLTALNSEIDESLLASESMQKELAMFKKRSVLVEPGEECLLCNYPLVTRRFVVFPCQHGFHADCVQKKLDTDWPRLHREVADECVLCCKENLRQIEKPLDTIF